MASGFRNVVSPKKTQIPTHNRLDTRHVFPKPAYSPTSLAHTIWVNQNQLETAVYKELAASGEKTYHPEANNSQGGVKLIIKDNQLVDYVPTPRCGVVFLSEPLMYRKIQELEAKFDTLQEVLVVVWS